MAGRHGLRLLADIQGFSHAGEREVLNNHFGQKFESLYFQGVVFQMTAVGRQCEGRTGFLQRRWELASRSSGWAARLLHLAFPFQGDQAPTRIVASSTSKRKSARC